MPTYDYECLSCNSTFEVFQHISEKPINKCAKCGKMSVRRLIGTGGAVIFKGSGFYQTDYRSKDYKSKAESENKNLVSGDKGSARKEKGASNTSANL